MSINKNIYNFIIIIFLSFFTFWWTFLIFHLPFNLKIVLTVIIIRMLASFFIFKDYSMAWSKVTPKSFLIKSLVYIVAFLVYMPLFYTKYPISLFITELFLYLFLINFLMYSYFLLKNKGPLRKNKNVIIYGAGKAGQKLAEELKYTDYKIRFFVDDNQKLQGRSIDGIKIISKEKLKKIIRDNKEDLLIIAMPSAESKRIEKIYNALKEYFTDIKILPSLNKILLDKPFSKQLKDISIEDLLARKPKDLDKEKIKEFIENKVVLITGAGGSIGSELSRQCARYGAKQLLLLENSEYNLYKIEQELGEKYNIVPILQDVSKKDLIEKTFKKYNIDIVLHAAAYKHVPLVEMNIEEAIINNIIGTKNVIDLAIKYNVKNFVLISTDKAVRPTNVMGATKRVCELYAQNVNSNNTDIVAVRFGNVLGSSGSVVPKFKEQILKGGPVTVTHPEITRYFMLIPEACQLVLQAGAIGKGGEVFILDMGKPVKIVDLAKKMIQMYGKEDEIEIKFTGLRPGEKLYEELLINESEKKTIYESIFIGKATFYPIEKLNEDIEELLKIENKIEKLKEIVPEFNHKS